MTMNLDTLALEGKAVNSNVVTCPRVKIGKGVETVIYKDRF